MQDKMKTHHVVSLLILLLQICQNTVLDISNTSCPLLCECFSETTVICSDLRMKALPVNLPVQATSMIVLASGLRNITIQEHLGNLSKLIFLNNPVQNVSRDAFKNLNILEELEISGSFYLPFEPGTFNGLDKLTKLLLNHNKILILAPTIFDYLGNLELLQLKGNMLKSLHPALFDKLYNLQELNLSSNKLSTIHTSELSKLKKLDLALNQITSLSLDTFIGNPELQILSLQGNRINKIAPGIFSHLKHLEELNLRDNNITELSAGLFPSHLKKLTLRGNSLSQLNSTVFIDLNNLTHLDLSQNKLSFLPAELFHNLSLLEHLDMSENLLQELANNAFRGLLKLHVLDLHKNNLNSLEVDLFKDQEKMSRLSLAWNKLENLPYAIFEPLHFECLLKLHGNPWRCDCDLRYLHEWLYHSSNSVEKLNQVFCANPQALEGKIISSINTEQLICLNRSIEETQHAIKQDTRTYSDRQCSLNESNGVIVVRCKITKCSDLKLNVSFHQADGKIFNYALTELWPGASQCLNGTVILTV